MAKSTSGSNKTKKPPKTKTKRAPIKKISSVLPKKPPQLTTTLAFYLDDYNKTLFPLITNKYLIEKGEAEIKKHIQRCLDDADEAVSFSAQRRVYAAKPNNYLRRTVKLDPVAEYFLYDVIFRNRAKFRKPHATTRTHYGYRFQDGSPIVPTAAYKAFKGALSEYSAKYKYCMGFDVASYFNNVYHHDIVSWFRELGASEVDAEALGQLLRQINSGRSVDCLPQGLYPSKMIGNDLLRFVDNFYDLKSERLIRFMDDMYIFSDDSQNIEDDFQSIQRLLGDKGLSINPGKTKINDAGHAKIDTEIDEVKRNLLQRRRLIMTVGYDDDGEEITKETMIRFPLSKKEIEYIDKLLKKPDLEEEDAELVLTIMRGHVDKVEGRLPDIIREYPHLAKNVYNFCASVPNKEVVADMVLDAVKQQSRLTEYQLFWFGAMLEDYFMSTPKAPELISRLLGHASATSISKAKILEISDLRFGLPDARNEHLKSGQSDWLAWSSAVGSRDLKPISRNHTLKYFGNSSQMNHLITTILLKN